MHERWEAVVMQDVIDEDERKHEQPSETDYGFNLSFWQARRLFHQRHNSQAPVYAEEGAWLDQPVALEDDVRTYAWLWDIAKGIREKNKAEEKKVKELMAGRGIR